MPSVDVTVRYLELTRPDELRPKRLPGSDVAVAKVDPPIPELNRFFYCAIGGGHKWLDRRQWTLREWTAYTDRSEIATWILTTQGVPAGYFELERQPDGAIEIKLFGILRQFVGQGLGAHMLTEACERAFATGASRVILNTCSLDHPGALRNYMARGFREYGSEVEHRQLPDRPPGPWEGSVDA
jgi:GNAT superfamily N-acetyltransferase